MSLKIVHIGKGTTPEEVKHITHWRDAGHEYYVPGDSTHEQLVRRILNADEIHIWDISDEFRLGMVYFYSIHAVHHHLHWRVRMFCDPTSHDALRPLFTQISKICPTCGGDKRIRHWYAQDEFGWKDCPTCCPGPTPKFVLPCERGTGGCDAERATICASRGGCAIRKKEFVPSCGSGLGPCKECAEEKRCDELRAKHGN